MADQIFRLVIDTVFGFFVFVLLMRFWMQTLRAPFRNPVGELVLALTGWIVTPARRFIPGLLGIDLATLVLAWLAQVAALALIGALYGAWSGLVLPVAAIDLARMSLQLLIVIVIVQVVLSWLNPRTPLTPLLQALTLPFYLPLRRFIPPLGSVDLTPLVLLLLAQIGIILLGGLTQAVIRL